MNSPALFLLRSRPIWLLLGALVTLPLRANDEGTIATDVVMDFAPAGKKLPVPTAAHPTYYLPLPYGYTERGEVINHFRRPQPPVEEVEQVITRMLAEQHYLLISKSIRPDIVLSMKWGYKAPNGRSIQDVAAMNEMVGGTLDNVLNSGAQTGIGAANVRDEQLFQLMRHPRWFIELTAMSVDDWRRHQVKLLWRETVSTDLWGHYMDQVLPTLIMAGAPYIGRPMTHPTLETVPVNLPPGWVTVGKAVEVGPK